MSFSKNYYVYILASKKIGTLYIGVTSDLVKRVYEHKHNLVEGFTQKYNVHNLVYYETTQNIESAITREKQLKKWNRKWKLELIEKQNPSWKDLYEEIIA
jgi:putative endonuclease